jgi:hypothetical protein
MWWSSRIGAPPGEQQHPQGVLGPRHRQRLGGETGAGGSDRIERVVLAAQATPAAGLAPDLEHRLAVLGQRAGQAGAVMAGTRIESQTESTGANLTTARRDRRTLTVPA